MTQGKESTKNNAKHLSFQLLVQVGNQRKQRSKEKSKWLSIYSNDNNSFCLWNTYRGIH